MAFLFLWILVRVLSLRMMERFQIFLLIILNSFFRPGRRAVFSCLFSVFVVYFLYSLCLFLEVSLWQKGLAVFLGEDVVAELDEYAKEWGMTRSAALTMIIKTVVGGKK